MSFSGFPQLRSFTVTEDGSPLALRLLLPPNLAAVAARGGTLAVKLEWLTQKSTADVAAGDIGSEQCEAAQVAANAVPRSAADRPLGYGLASGDAAAMWAGFTKPCTQAELQSGKWLPQPQAFIAALLIESWCGGRIPPLLQLSADQLRQLLQPLEGLPAVFWLKEPSQPVAWRGGELDGVHVHLHGATSGKNAASSDSPVEGYRAISGSASAGRNRSISEEGGTGSGGFSASAHLHGGDFRMQEDAVNVLPPMEPHLTPLEVDGSLNFIALRLPSRESVLYPHALELAKEWGFRAEPSNGRWWLRDRHKTLQFLAENIELLRTQFGARFTDNFAERTRGIRMAQMRLEVGTSTPRGGDSFEVELAVRADGLDEAALQQALDKGQFYLEVPSHGGATGGFAQQRGGSGRNVPQRGTAGRSHGGRPSSDASLTGANPAKSDEQIVILLPHSVRENMLTAQRELDGDPLPRLRACLHKCVKKEEVAVAQSVLLRLAGSGSQATAMAADASLSSGGLQAAADGAPDVSAAPRGLRGSVAPQCASAGSRRASRSAAPTDDAGDESLLGARLPAQWLELSRALGSLDRLAPCPAFPPLDAQLRPYQKVGVAWLWHLFRNGLGGILADEMGLGKTVQTLAFLSALHPADAPSLVVCPAALVENWRREAAAFTPQLRVFCHYGASRLAAPADARRYDVILTSYGTLTRDQVLFEQMGFCVVVGDEAQQVKNAKTRNAKALRALRAQGRFLLTGTPLENDIDELVALFAFILPGYLSKEKAARAAASAGMSAEELRAMERRRIIARAAPYLLRRMKRSVAAELPEKIEQTIYCEFSPQQRAFYLDVQRRARLAVQELELSGAAEGRVRMAAFAELLRLRQVCIDPQLVGGAWGRAADGGTPSLISDDMSASGSAATFAGDDAVNYSAAGGTPFANGGDAPAAGQADLAVDAVAGSAKRAALGELLQEAVSGGHRVLVFSQFTAALRLVAEDVEALGLRYFYLDGKTKDRAALCERFNKDESVSVFLISLRAGGTGLNLTGADTVVHLDPWWNPAVQAQATDRAHRIGQRRVVTVYQLIAAETVEEQVLALQRRKAELLEQLLDASDAASDKIALADIKALIG